ncbi:uncharacterized protein At3g17950-like [Rhodamnia argentea]|uniref:Uncharacterized protein At3g17950-like n=1 Tax=Rhodamnia argentea TaxID=178133 RepID=A0A8B8NPC3_9MYRT|nr:uncharacterized protein At3g17950-like [Rhodamnia argentea]
MAQQREGWPLGLQPVNVRVGLGRNNRGRSAGSISFNTLLTGSPTSSCTDFSSDLDTESTGSFFHDRSITLGSLMGASTMLELSRRSTRIRKPEAVKKSCKPRIWLFSLCSGVSTDVERMDNDAAQSLGQFLAVERKAANGCRRIGQGPITYGPDEIVMAQGESGPSNSLFVDGRVAPPPRASPGAEEGDGPDGYGVSLILCCACGNGSH